MTKPNLKDLTDEELDKLAAELLGWELVSFPNHFKGKEFYRHESSTLRIIWKDKWHPTKDANQIQGYLFPKLREKSVEIYTYDNPVFFEIKMYDSSSLLCLIKKNYYDIQINRITVEACIEALWKIGESGE